MVIAKLISFLFRKPWLAIILIVLVFVLLMLMVWMSYDDLPSPPKPSL